jgi:hypothetical protein
VPPVAADERASGWRGWENDPMAYRLLCCRDDNDLER